MKIEMLFALSLTLYVVAAGFSLTGWRWPDLGRRMGYGLSMAASLAGFFVSVAVLLSHQPVRWRLPLSGPWMEWTMEVDSLAAFFLLLLTLVSLVVSLYALGYAKKLQTRQGAAPLGMLYNLFLLSMVLAATADNAILFLAAWEMMSLTSYGMVVFEHEKKDVRQTGLIYLVMTHLGAAFLVMMFLWLGQGAGDFSFEAIAAAGPNLPMDLRHLVFFFALIGFGAKAGLAPFHIWLPRAHPVAPSHVSALMSGVMLKTAVYAFIRVVFDLLGIQAVPLLWGTAVLVLGTLSALMGVLYALVEKDIKRLLAFSSMENVGIIFMGLGASLMALAGGQREIAALAFLAALLHLFNHGLFKGLLFCGAGAVDYGAHTKNMELLGGLIKTMPWTALWFLSGSLALSAMPPFNGFISEWLTFQSLLALGQGGREKMVQLLAPLSGAALALVGALVASTMVKAFGTSFLALPRSEQAAHAREAPRTMLWAMGVLGALCLFLGISPAILFRLLEPLAQGLLGTGFPIDMGAGGWLAVVSGRQEFALFSPAALAGVLAFSVVLAVVLARSLGGPYRERVEETWDCGIPALTPRMEYTASAFTQPLKRVFRSVFLQTKTVETTFGNTPYFPKGIRYRVAIHPLFETMMYRPLYNVTVRIAKALRHFQTGSIQFYLGYILLALVALLIWGR